jgi:hypothetical protein
MKLTQFEDSATTRAIVYGDPFTGKTTLAGMLAKEFKLKWLDIESGASSLLRNIPKQYHDNIDLIQIPDSKVNPIAAETCLKVIDGGKCIICVQHGKVNCPLCNKAKQEGKDVLFNEICLREMQKDEIFVLDSATQLSNSIMSHITRNQKDDYKPDWDDYAVQGRLLDKMFTQMQAGRYNAVVISHAALVGTEKSEKILKLVPIGGTTSYSRTFAKFFDEVIYCELLNGKHKFTSKTGASPQVITGSKNNIAIEGMAEPSLIPFFK